MESAIGTILLTAIIWLSFAVYNEDKRDDERAEVRRRQKKKAIENEWRDYEAYMDIKNAVNFYEAARESEKY